MFVLVEDTSRHNHKTQISCYIYTIYKYILDMGNNMPFKKEVICTESHTGDLCTQNRVLFFEEQNLKVKARKHKTQNTNVCCAYYMI